MVTPEMAAVLTFVTMSHEGQHVGETLVNKGEFKAKWKGEFGFKFERRAFGKPGGYITDNVSDFEGEHPMFYDRVTDSTTESIERMDVIPTKLERTPMAEKQPLR
jgi:hypothetical protein